MALSKGNNRGTSSMTDLLSSGIDNGSERIVMSLDPAAMGKIMDRLTDLYTDPILATVREVISNALDATAVSRTNGLDPNPVKITLPNQFEPEFVVEDNGVGMSREIIKDIFAKYGASTKEDNFNQVGAFGLGAKSPLAYCEEFYFTTTRDGVTSEVAVTRLDTGPETNILSITDTGNPSGTIMRVPVRNTDYDFLNFKNAAESYQKYAFTMDEPIIVNGVEYFGNEDFYQFDDIEIEPELNIAGRVWMNKNNLERISAMIDSQYEASISPKIGYVISGFLYRDPAGNKSYAGNGEYEPDLIVELKPGVVEFSSSRDEIMKDTRFDYFNKLVKGQISNPSYFFGNLIKFYKTIENNSEAYKILYSFNYKLEDDKVIFAKEVPEYINKVDNVSHHEVSVSELTTNNGYNPVAENKKFEKDNVFVGVLYPLVHDEKKFNLIDLRRPYVQNSEIGRRKEAKVKNIESPSVSEANTRFAGTLYSNEKVSLLDSIDVLKKRKRSNQ